MDVDILGLHQEGRAAAKAALAECRTDDERWELVRAALAESDYANILTMRAASRSEAILDLVAPDLPERARTKAIAWGNPLDGRIAALRRAAEAAQKKVAAYFSK